MNMSEYVYVLSSQITRVMWSMAV